MISREELFLGLAVAGLFLGSISYIALSDALKNFRRRLSQMVFRPIIGIGPPPPPTRRKRGLRRIK